MSISATEFCPRGFGIPLGISLPSLSRIGGRLRFGVSNATLAEYGNRSYISGYFKKASCSFSRKFSICRNSSGLRLAKVILKPRCPSFFQYNSNRCRLRMITLKFLRRGSDSLCVVTYLSIISKNEISLSFWALGGLWNLRTIFSRNDLSIIDLSSAVCTSFSICSVKAFNLVFFSKSISLSSPGILGMLISFFFPHRLASTQIPLPMRILLSLLT